jgi:DHA1 family inner membrane transport protein
MARAAPPVPGATSIPASPAPALSRGLLLTLSGVNFVIGMGAFLVIGALAPMARGLEMSEAQAGWVLTSYAIAYAILSPTLVATTGRVGRRRILTVGLILFGLGCAASALAPSPAMLFGARVLAAAGAGMVTPVSAAVVAALAPPERRAKALAAVFFGLTLAQVAGVPTGSWIAYEAGWRAAFWVVAGLAALGLVALRAKVPAAVSFQPVRPADLLGVLRDGRLMLAILFTSTLLGAVYIPFTYLSPILEETMGLGRDGVTLALAVYGLGAVAGNLLGGWAADRIGPYRSLLIVACSQVLLTPALSLLPLPLPATLTLLFVWATLGWSFMAGQQARLAVLAGPQTPVALALNAAAIYVGAALGAAAGGLALGLVGLGGLGLVGGLAGLLAVANIALSHRLSPAGR